MPSDLGPGSFLKTSLSKSGKYMNLKGRINMIDMGSIKSMLTNSKIHNKCLRSDSIFILSLWDSASQINNFD